MVLLTHAWGAAGGPRFQLGPLDFTFILQNSRFGVDLFFVLSGYLLFGQYVRRHSLGVVQPRWHEFWWRRIKRVVPAYYVMVVVAFVTLPYLYVPLNGNGSAWENLLSHLLFLHNFSPSYVQSVPAVWSLAPEAQFYLIMPLLVALIFRLPAWRWSVVAIWGGSAIWSIFLLPNDSLLLFRLNQFLAGFIAAAWLPRLQALSVVQRNQRASALLLQAGGLSGILSMMFLNYLQTFPELTSSVGKITIGSLNLHLLVDLGYYLTQPLVGLALMLLLCGAVAECSNLSRFWHSRWLGFLGVISYGAFLWHGLLVTQLMRLPVLTSISEPSLRLVVFFGIVSGGGVIAGWLSYVFIEAPFMRPVSQTHVIATVTPSTAQQKSGML